MRIYPTIPRPGATGIAAKVRGGRESLGKRIPGQCLGTTSLSTSARLGQGASRRWFCLRRAGRPFAVSSPSEPSQNVWSAALKSRDVGPVSGISAEAGRLRGEPAAIRNQRSRGAPWCAGCWSEAQYIGTVRPETDLRRYGLRLKIEGEGLHAIFCELKGALREHTERPRKLLSLGSVPHSGETVGNSRNPFKVSAERRR